MITSINEFRKYLIAEYNNSAMKDHYNKLINDGSEEQEALLNTASWFETTKDIVHQALQDAAGTHTITESINPVETLIRTEISNNFVDFLSWTTPIVEDHFNKPNLIVEEDFWEDILQDSKNGTISEDQINQGLCNQFALYIKSKIPSVEIEGDVTQHVVVKYNNLYYDSENPEGKNSVAELYSAEGEFFKNRKLT